MGEIAPYGNSRVVKGLVGALLDDDWAVKKAAATSIGIVARVGDDEAVDALLPLLEAADWRVRKTALKAIGSVAEHGCQRAIQAILLRLEDTCVAAPKRLDQGNAGVRDVKLMAIAVVQQLAVPRDAAVLVALRKFQNGLELPQDDKLHAAVREACHSIASSTFAGDSHATTDGRTRAQVPGPCYSAMGWSSDDSASESESDSAVGQASVRAAVLLGSTPPRALEQDRLVGRARRAHACRSPADGPQSDCNRGGARHAASEDDETGMADFEDDASGPAAERCSSE